VARLNAFWYPDQTGDQPADMPRYFFNVRAEQSSVDDEGEELPDGPCGWARSNHGCPAKWSGTSASVTPGI